MASLVQAFESATIPPTEFGHLAHIAVALSYLSHLPAPAALERMRSSVKNFAAHHGANHRYHETLTIFWMRLLGHLNALYPAHLPCYQKINLITLRWGTRRPAEAHYSPELLDSTAARESWMPPDLLPLPF